MNKKVPLGGHGPDARSQWASPARTQLTFCLTHTHIYKLKVVTVCSNKLSPGRKQKLCAEKRSRGRRIPPTAPRPLSMSTQRVGSHRCEEMHWLFHLHVMSSLQRHESKSKSVWDAKAQQSRCILRFMRRVHLHCTHLMTLYHGLCSRLSPPQKPPTTIVYSYKLFKCNLFLFQFF